MLSLLDGSKRFLQLIIGGQPSPDSARIGMIYGFLIILEGEASHCGPSAFSCQYEKLRVNSAEATALPTAIGTDCNNLFVGASLLSNVGLRAGGPPYREAKGRFSAVRQPVWQRATRPPESPHETVFSGPSIPPSALQSRPVHKLSAIRAARRK
jgi:hypothetical protein